MATYIIIFHVPKINHMLPHIIVNCHPQNVFFTKTNLKMQKYLFCEVKEVLGTAIPLAIIIYIISNTFH